MSDFSHIPVLPEEIIGHLSGPRVRLLADATVGLGGHSARLLEANPQARLLACDRDPQALERARARLAGFGDRVSFQLAPFADFELPVAEVDGLLADFGASSLQLDDAARGFAFRADGPLDMRMGPDAARTAAELVNEGSEEELTRWIGEYGEEPAARRVAAAIVKARRLGAIETTGELARIVRQHARPPKRGRGKPTIDAATRTFQGLRIAVNDELGQIERALPRFWAALAPGGRLAVLSFHSLEDRLVKRAFKVFAREGRLLTPKPEVASEAEASANPRSRSAKLRVVEKGAAPGG